MGACKMTQDAHGPPARMAAIPRAGKSARPIAPPHVQQSQATRVATFLSCMKGNGFEDASPQRGMMHSSTIPNHGALLGSTEEFRMIFRIAATDAEWYVKS